MYSFQERMCLFFKYLYFFFNKKNKERIYIKSSILVGVKSTSKINIKHFRIVVNIPTKTQFDLPVHIKSDEWRNHLGITCICNTLFLQNNKWNKNKIFLSWMLIIYISLSWSLYIFLYCKPFLIKDRNSKVHDFKMWEIL